MRFRLILALLSLFCLAVLACRASLPSAPQSTAPEKVILPGSGAASLTPTAPTAPLPSPTLPPPLSEETLKNALYTLADFPELGEGGRFRLQNGEYRQEATAGQAVVQLLRTASGELDGDGLGDAAAVLAVNTGGSGTFIYLVAFLNRNGQPWQAALRALGDRTQVESLQIAGRRVSIGMVTHGADDPLCCPSVPLQEEYQLQEGQLLTPMESILFPRARQVVQALQERDADRLAQFVHPRLGVRFSPYSYVRPEHLVFRPAQVKNLLNDPQQYTWGVYDGSGEPIRLTFSQYLDQFVYPVDFAAGQMSLNRPIGSGNTINNINEFYPGAMVVEFYIPGSEQYSFMDWRSLRLVFQVEGGEWYLVGIVNDQWTI